MSYDSPWDKPWPYITISVITISFIAAVAFGDLKCNVGCGPKGSLQWGCGTDLPDYSVEEEPEPPAEAPDP